MDFDELRQLAPDQLDEYVWRRLRAERPIDPPVASRFGEEAPEQFIIRAAEEKEDRAFRARLVAAVRKSFRRLVQRDLASEQSIWRDAVTDEQVASLAFLIAEMGASELVDAVYALACSWIIVPGPTPHQLTFGQLHLLRSLAVLQQGGKLSSFWEDLWHDGPRSLRGLVIYGWARACADKALDHLAELAQMEEEIDLPATLWSLLDGDGPGLAALAARSKALSEENRCAIRRALVTAGADEKQLRDFDFQLASAVLGGEEFPWSDDVVPKDPETAREHPQWQVPEKQAA